MAGEPTCTCGHPQGDHAAGVNQCYAFKDEANKGVGACLCASFKLAHRTLRDREPVLDRQPSISDRTPIPGAYAKSPWDFSLQRLDSLKTQIDAHEKTIEPVRQERAELSAKLYTDVVLALPWEFLRTEKWGVPEGLKGVFHTVSFRYIGPPDYHRQERQLLGIERSPKNLGLHPRPGWVWSANHETGAIEVVFSALPVEVHAHLVSELTQVRMDTERRLNLAIVGAQEALERAQQLRAILDALLLAEGRPVANPANPLDDEPADPPSPTTFVPPEQES